MIKFILFTISLGFFTGCVTGKMYRTSDSLKSGDSMEIVYKTMGSPENRQFNENKELWQYCETGSGKDYYLQVWFKDEKIESLKTYSRHGNAFGMCDENFSQANWQSKPDTIIEVRDN
jgi:hypothetical protein